MSQGEQRSRFCRASARIRPWLLSVLVAVLVADLPLAVVYSLKAQLHYLGSFGVASALASEVHETETLPRSVAFNLEPEGVLQRPTAETAQPNASPFAPPESSVLPDPTWRLVHAMPPEDDAYVGYPLPRAYDPHAPPSRSP